MIDDRPALPHDEASPHALAMFGLAATTASLLSGCLAIQSSGFGCCWWTRTPAGSPAVSFPEPR